MPLRSSIAGLALVALSAPVPRARAEISVPLELQVDLMRRVVRFERGFAGRISGEVRLMVAARPADAASSRVAAQLAQAISQVREIAGQPVRVLTHRYESPAALKQAITAQQAQVLYLPSGLDKDLSALAAGLAGVPVITITTDGDLVERGAVLGFELVSARPKIVLNLGQARRQALDFSSDLFRLARVIK